VRAPRLIVGFAALMTLLALLFYRFPGLHMLTWSAIGVASAGAVALGVSRYRPRRPWPWIALAVGLLAFAAGDTTYNVLTTVLGQDQPFPSAADVVYLGLFFPLIAAGLLGLARSGAASRDRASLLDAIAVTLSLGLLFWLFLIDPRVYADTSVLDRAISVAYPLCDILLLAVIARLVTAVRWSPAVVLLALGGLGLLVADVLYGLSQLEGGWAIGGPVDLGWIFFYAFFGLAALHPSMVEITAPRLLATTGLHPARLALLALSTLIAPTVALVEGAQGRARNASVATVVAAAMFVVVIARLYAAMNTHRAAVARERGLRQSALALVSATSAAEVESVTRAAVAQLLPPGVDHQVELSPPDPEHSTGLPATGVHLAPTGTLEAGTAKRLRRFDTVAYSRLVVGELPRHGDHGMLTVAALDTELAPLREALQVLAAQAAFALNRIALDQEIGRRNSEAYFRTLVQNTSDVILIIDEDGRIAYASPSAETVFGRGELVGQRLPYLVRPDDSSHPSPAMPDAEPPAGLTQDWVVSRADGRRVQVEASISDLRDDPTVAGLVVTLRDVTERRRLESELTHRAFHDSLTGLANRVLFQSRVDQAVQRSRADGSIAGVIFIDLDDFKIVNDTMGHAIGDELLQAVSSRLRGALRSGDTAARLGGDEFAALVEDASDPAQIEAVAERVIVALLEPFAIGPSIINGMASIGVATTSEAADGAELMRQADMALYVAKGAGKGQWRRYQAALHAAVLERLQMRQELDEALHTGAFILQYQPVVALDTGLTVGFEALIRWSHPVRGTVRPDQFISVAEDSGLIVPIGDWVLETALSNAALWAAATPGEAPYISVNVSTRQLRQPGFVDSILVRLARHRLPPERLVVEITESLMLRDSDHASADLEALRAAGARVAIDDFGTGYSSLSYLRQVPADILKIERSFIDTVPVSTQQRAMVESIARLADTLGMAVVAEGIEQPSERDVLVDVGCQYGQGFLFSPPLDPGDAVAWLKKEHIAA
jgi:diguanylate cyclase (GGDEF)-like protein/PAS domain S-box-containing protein